MIISPPNNGSPHHCRLSFHDMEKPTEIKVRRKRNRRVLNGGLLPMITYRRYMRALATRQNTKRVPMEIISITISSSVKSAMDAWQTPALTYWNLLILAVHFNVVICTSLELFIQDLGKNSFQPFDHDLICHLKFQLQAVTSFQLSSIVTCCTSNVQPSIYCQDMNKWSKGRLKIR